MEFIGGILQAVATFVSGFPIVAAFIGVALVATTIYVMCMRNSSSNVDDNYVRDQGNVYGEIQQNNPDVHMGKTKEQFQEQLNQFKGEACVVDNKIWHWDRETQDSVNVILDRKENNQEKKETYRLFVNTCFEFVSKAISGNGENKINQDFDSFDPKDKILASLKYDLDTKLLKLIFTFTGGSEFFDLVRLLLETLQDKGLIIDMDKYEKEFKDFEFDEDGNKYILKIQN